MKTIDFDLIFKKIILKGTIYNDTKLYNSQQFLLDTGEVCSILHEDIAKHIGFDVSKSKKNDYQFLSTASGRVQTQIVKLRQLTVLGRDFKNIKVGLLRIPPQAQLDMIIGMDILEIIEEFKINIPNKQITIY